MKLIELLLSHWSYMAGFLLCIIVITVCALAIIGGIRTILGEQAMAKSARAQAQAYRTTMEPTLQEMRKELSALKAIDPDNPRIVELVETMRKRLDVIDGLLGG